MSEKRMTLLEVLRNLREHTVSSYYKEVDSAIAKAEQLQAQLAKHRWIKITPETKFKDKEWLLLLFKSGYVTDKYWDAKWDGTSKFAYYLRLPPLPKEKSDE